jgi:hypothetical protein
MNTPAESKSFNITGLVAIVVFLGTVIYLSMVMGVNDRIERDLKKQKLKSELLLSERLAEEKKNAELNSLYADLEERYSASVLNLDRTRNMVIQKERELESERASANPLRIAQQATEIDWLKKKLADDSIGFVTLKASLESDKTGLHDSVTKAYENGQRYLYDLNQLTQLRLSSISTEVARKNNKLTAKASKSKSIALRISVSEDVKKLHFKIIDPAEHELVVSDKNLSWHLVDNHSSSASKAFYVNPELQTSINSNIHEVEMLYRPDKKLEAGNYTIGVYNESRLMGNIRFRLE